MHLNTVIGAGHVFPDGSCAVLWPRHDVRYVFATHAGGFADGVGIQLRERGADPTDSYLVPVPRPTP